MFNMRHYYFRLSSEFAIRYEVGNFRNLLRQINILSDWRDMHSPKSGIIYGLYVKHEEKYEL